MNNLVWDAALWLRKKLSRDKEDIIQAVNNIQNLFETSVDATASASDILEGQTAYNGTTLLTGSMKNRRGTTVTSEVVTQDANYTYFAVPEEACYNANSKVRALNDNIFGRIYNTLVTQGVTPASKNIADLENAITVLKTNNYNNGYANGCNVPKTVSMTMTIVRDTEDTSIRHINIYANGTVVWSADWDHLYPGSYDFNNFTV